LEKYGLALLIFGLIHTLTPLKEHVNAQDICLTFKASVKSWEKLRVNTDLHCGFKCYDLSHSGTCQLVGKILLFKTLEIKRSIQEIVTDQSSGNSDTVNVIQNCGLIP
jgi:hypothetical protein